ncbi:MAG: formylglycine-generating enzyme family protein, partial [Marinisporobacter sp.]|nr:formylglycine-generating enzyme family protein [Marinisporobacter sp.]
VEKPLDIEFEIKTDEVLNLSPEVLSTESFDAADFGYTTFDFIVREFFDLAVSTFVYNEVNLNIELTSANIEITSEEKQLYSGELKAETNIVRINNGYSKYKIRITKEGYDDFLYTYSSDSIKKHIGNPLEILLKNNVTLPAIEYIEVEGGEFLMGSENGEENEKPIHTVTVNSFLISKYEITQAQFIHFLNEIKCNSNGYYNDNEYGFIQYIDMADEDCAVGYGANHFYFKGSSMVPSADCSANEITWFGANAYCKWVGGRLPYEAEWEFAARGGNKGNGFTFSGSDNYDDVAWNILNDNGQIHPVGQKQANELGIYDMSGNVYEWCFDWLGDYISEKQNNPKGPTSGYKRIRRGGGWNSDFIYCRSAFRSFHYPDGSNNDDGIRVVLDIN